MRIEQSKIDSCNSLVGEAFEIKIFCLARSMVAVTHNVKVIKVVLSLSRISPGDKNVVYGGSMGSDSRNKLKRVGGVTRFLYLSGIKRVSGIINFII